MLIELLLYVMLAVYFIHKSLSNLCTLLTTYHVWKKQTNTIAALWVLYIIAKYIKYAWSESKISIIYNARNYKSDGGGRRGGGIWFMVPIYGGKKFKSGEG